MGRRQFQQDLACLIDDPPPHVSDVHRRDDNEISFVYTYQHGGEPINIVLALLALDTDDYPHNVGYMILTEEEVEPVILQSFDTLSTLIADRPLSEAFVEISACLWTVVTAEQTASVVNPSESDLSEHSIDSDLEQEDDASADESWMDGDADVDDDLFGLGPPKSFNTFGGSSSGKTAHASSVLQRAKADIRRTHSEGFRVGVSGDLKPTGTIVVSVRIARLGISEEAMQAWGVNANQYFVLLIRYQNGYQHFDQIVGGISLRNGVDLRVGLCNYYKPHTQSVAEAFAESSSSSDHTPLPQQEISKRPNDLQPLFISRPMNEMLRTKLSKILDFRRQIGVDWATAEQLVHERQGVTSGDLDLKDYAFLQESQSKVLPSIVTADSMRDDEPAKVSFPLIAMQFALRHFVRCTEFCLVCSRSVGNNFEALKPYVCSSPLCLYQYMSLGFGPSIDWEVLSQPYVVDLLVSFCYTQAQHHKLRAFPDGLGLRVPILPHMHTAPLNTWPQAGTTVDPPTVSQWTSVMYNGAANEIIFASDVPVPSQYFKAGDWIALMPAHYYPSNVTYHRIVELTYPTVKLSPGIRVDLAASQTSHANSSREGLINAQCFTFSYQFDDLASSDKHKAILTLLDTLPPVKEMLQYLQTHSVGHDSSLKQWRDRLVSPALDILRWVIASNRSCIMQVDSIVDPDKPGKDQPSGDRVSGMNDYMQFRFAQGAPDKEQRFMDCVQQHAGHKECPTIFAWHGSSLHSWHSIIREGLHFQETVNGRAFGNGVYMSPYAKTSLGYCRTNNTASWPNSELRISNAISLNEVVNKPEAFVSKTPHYVVKDLDWIQTRYLMVKTVARHTKQPAACEMLLQDNAHRVHGANESRIEIPVTAISKSRRLRVLPAKSSRKRRVNGSEVVLDDVDDACSELSLAEDRAWLNESEYMNEEDVMSDIDDQHYDDGKGKQNETQSMMVIEGCRVDFDRTDFVPGKLDMTNIALLPAPQNATSLATKALMKEFAAVCTTQEKVPAHDLGWYINPEGTENMYQWLFELHSFDKALPLSKDMKSSGQTSIVLEMLFTSEFPHAPPFVRVVKPRFLPFAQGGGGHVLEGGAICMELLTNSGWTVVSTIESVLLQIRLAMGEQDRPARLLHKSGKAAKSSNTYGMWEAMQAYERACRAHGWRVPESFASLRQK